jgi:diguanylate cyclase (GGDEF)-like protein
MYKDGESMIDSKNQLQVHYDSLTHLKDLDGLFVDYENKDLRGAHFIYVDIDDFNKMNIIFGIDTVDDMLVDVARTLKNYCGKSSLYRIGNDQFLIVTHSHIICEPTELQRLLKQPFQHHKIQYVINASVVVADYDDFNGETLKEMVNMLHYAIDKTRNQGRNRLLFLEDKHRTQYKLIKEVESNIYDAMKKGQFYPKFRPFVDTFNNEIVGFEAVSRWDLNGRMLRPQDFLEIAEWTGIIYDLELSIFEQSLSFFRELKEDKTITLSKRFKSGVIFSANTLLRIEIKTITELLKMYQISAKEVIIEIKESNIKDQTLVKKIKNLYEMGFVIILDDYSNKSSSLTYLADLKVDVLKLSESMLDDVKSSQEYNSLKSVYQFFVDISKEFNLSVVSSGIKSKQDLKFVRNLGVNIGTGDYFSRAIVKDEFVDYLRNNKKRVFR